MLKYAIPAAVAALVAGLTSCSSPPPPPVYLQELHEVTIEEKKVTPKPKPKPVRRVESAEGFRAVY